MGRVTVRLKCQNIKCGNEFLRSKDKEEFERIMESRFGYSCESCGFPNMEHMRSNRSARDGFQPGWQENIKQWAWSRGEYNRILARMGMEEIGYDYTPQEDFDPTHVCANKEFAEEAARFLGPTGGVAAKAIETGEFFKDESNVDLDTSA